MDRLGVTPTIQTSKNFEEIARTEEAASAPVTSLADRLSNTPPLLYGRDMDLSHLACSDEYDSDDEIFPPSYYMTGKKYPSRAPTPEPAPKKAVGDMDVDSDDDEVSLGNSEDERPPPIPPRSITPISAPITPSADIYRYLEDGDVPRYAQSYEGEVDHNLDWQVLDSFGRISSLTEPFTGEQLVFGRAVDRAFQINNFFLNCDHKDHLSQTNKWIVDSGASLHFSGDKSDFTDLTMFPKAQRPNVATADSQATIFGRGTIFMENSVTEKGIKTTNVMRLHPVFYLPGLTT